MRMSHLLTATLPLVIAVTAVAQPSGCIKSGTVLETTADVIVRKTPPQEKFLFVVGEPGAQVAKLPIGEKLTVKHIEFVSAPFRTDVWAKGATNTGLSGWVYCGSTKELANFKIAQ